MSCLRTLNFWIELFASLWTLAGIRLGSTTLTGATCYAVSLVFWYWLMVRRRAWGLALINVATTIAVADIYVRAL